MDPRTIDNLGIESSARYAADREFYDASLLQEGRSVSMQTSVDVTTPFYKPSFSLLFETQKRNLPWGAIIAPKDYNLQKNRLFTEQIVPSLGSEEWQLTQIEKIKMLMASREKERGAQAPKKEDLSWQREKERNQDTRESETLTRCLEQIADLNRINIFIDSKRNQYQKG